MSGQGKNKVYSIMEERRTPLKKSSLKIGKLEALLKKASHFRNKKISFNDI